MMHKFKRGDVVLITGKKMDQTYPNNKWIYPMLGTIISPIDKNQYIPNTSAWDYFVDHSIGIDAYWFEEDLQEATDLEKIIYCQSLDEIQSILESRRQK